MVSTLKYVLLRFLVLNHGDEQHSSIDEAHIDSTSDCEVLNFKVRTTFVGPHIYSIRVAKRRFCYVKSYRQQHEYDV